MGNVHQDRWIDQLPWTLLSKRVALQADLGASAAQLTFGGLNPSLPGALLQDPGAPMSKTQLRDLVANLQSRTDVPAVQTSRHQPDPQLPDAVLPPGTTHVMTRQHKTTGLDPNWAGPFPILEHMSRSQIKIKVGHFRDGSIKSEIRRLHDIKPAYLEPGSVDAERPARGRPPKRPPPSTSDPLQTPSTSEAASPTNMSTNFFSETTTNVIPQNVNTQPVDISPPNSNPQSYRDALLRPIRATRNPKPRYVDAITPT